MPAGGVLPRRGGIVDGAGEWRGVGDGGGLAPNLKSNREGGEVVLEAVGKAGLKAGEDIFIALDVASSELWAGGGKYTFKKSGEPDRTSVEMTEDGSVPFSFVAADLAYPVPPDGIGDNYVFYIGFDPQSLASEPKAKTRKRK